MEGVGGGAESVHDSVLPTYQGNNVPHTAEVYMTQ